VLGADQGDWRISAAMISRNGIGVSLPTRRYNNTPPRRTDEVAAECGDRPMENSHLSGDVAPKRHFRGPMTEIDRIGAGEVRGLSELLSRFQADRSALWRQVIRAVDDAVAAPFLQKQAPEGPDLLNLGCGPLIYPDWVNADRSGFYRLVRERAFKPQWLFDAAKPWRCRDDRWGGIFTQHMIEHLDYPEVVFVFRECLRTLKPGAWLRVSVPDIEKARSNPSIHRYPMAVSYVAQHHGHRSVWNPEMMVELLTDLGFVAASEVQFGEGSDPRLLMDQEVKRVESLYVEAQKPASARARS
jgi:predicted SAM-dependent methyltransferase